MERVTGTVNRMHCETSAPRTDQKRERPTFPAGTYVECAHPKMFRKEVHAPFDTAQCQLYRTYAEPIDTDWSMGAQRNAA